jgi:hypothetical protein
MGAFYMLATAAFLTLGVVGAAAQANQQQNPKPQRTAAGDRAGEGERHHGRS